MASRSQQIPNGSSYNLISGAELPGSNFGSTGKRVFEHSFQDHLKHSSDGLTGTSNPVTHRGRMQVSGSSGNASSGIMAVLNPSEVHVVPAPASARPRSAFSVKHDHSNGVKGSIDQSTPVVPAGSSSRIRTFAGRAGVSQESPFYRPQTATPSGRTSGAATSYSHSDASVPAAGGAPSLWVGIGAAPGVNPSGELAPAASARPAKYKKNNTLNSSQVFTLIQPDYDPRSAAATPAGSRMTVHLAKDAGAAEALLGSRDTATTGQQASFLGTRKRTRDEVKRVFEDMPDHHFTEDGRMRTDRLRTGRGKKHVAEEGPGKGSTDYNILAPPTDPGTGAANTVARILARPQSARMVSHTSGVASVLGGVVAADALEASLRSKPLSVPGVTGSISVGNFAKLCMGSEEGELPKTGGVVRAPPGYRDASTFANSFMALVPLATVAPTPVPVLAAAAAAAAAEEAEASGVPQSARLSSKAPFGNDFNDGLAKRTRTYVPARDDRENRNPITGSLVQAAKSAAAAPAGEAAIAGASSQRHTDRIWGFDATSKAPPVRTAAVPFATVSAPAGESFATSSLTSQTPVVSTIVLPVAGKPSGAPTSARAPVPAPVPSHSAAAAVAAAPAGNSFASAFESAASATAAAGPVKPLFPSVASWKAPSQASA